MSRLEILRRSVPPLLLRNKNCFLYNERRPPARHAKLRMTSVLSLFSFFVVPRRGVVSPLEIAFSFRRLAVSYEARASEYAHMKFGAPSF